MSSPLNPADLYHTGIVVPDLEASMARMSEAAGYRWTDIQASTMPVMISGEGERTLELRFVYSLDAPRIELVQEIPGTPWTAAPNVATHHLGFFCDDVVTTSKRLEAAGFALETCAWIDGSPSVFAYHLAPSGERIEIVDRARIPDMEEYLRARSGGNR